MDVSDQVPGAFSAVVEPGAEPSPPEAVAPESVAEPEVSAAPPVAPDPTPDIDTLVQQRVDALETQRLATEQQAKEREQEQMRLQMRQQVSQNAVAFASELGNEDPSLAQRFMQIKSFVEQERDEAFVQRDNGLKALDAVMLVLERDAPELAQKVIATAKTLMPYQTHEEMGNFLTQQANQTSAKDAEIARLQSQIDALTQQVGGISRDPNADRVETGGTGIPVAGTVTDPRQAQNWAEWQLAVQQAAR